MITNVFLIKAREKDVKEKIQTYICITHSYKADRKYIQGNQKD